MKQFLYPISLLQHTLVVFCVVLDFPSTIWTSHFCSFLLLLRAIISSVPITAVAVVPSLLSDISLTVSFYSFPFFSLIYSVLTPSFAPLPSVSSKGDPMKVFNCSEMPTVSWTKWLSRLVSWHESLIHFSSSLFAVIQKLSVSGESWTHSQTHFISLFFESSRLYIIEAVKMSD